MWAIATVGLRPDIVWCVYLSISLCVLRTTMISAKTDGPIEMPFGGKILFAGMHIGAT